MEGVSSELRRALLRWYERGRRDLPWRRTRDPYRIWISEIMLQQTRVQAVIPYYQRFLDRFPSVECLAEAPEQELLAAWAGLGYYSRARNLQRAARAIVACGSFPADHASIRALPGIGDYTAAAIASIAFGLAYAALDGNVRRVLSRLTAETTDVGAPLARGRLRAAADTLLDPKHPGEFNQALMELGATVCLPTQPRCELCPVAPWCKARELHLEAVIPIKKSKPATSIVKQQLLIIRRSGKLLCWQRASVSRRMPGFWELPEIVHAPLARLIRPAGEFRHTIVNTSYRVAVWEASVRATPPGLRWIGLQDLPHLPLSTTARKALARLTK